MSADAAGTRAVDTLAIHEVLHRYCRGIDRRDQALLESCYHLDSIDQRASFAGPGHEFARYAIGEVGPATFTQHRLSNIMVEFDGERAFAESYINAIHRFDHRGRPVDFLHYGRYLDVLECREGIWKILYRLHVPDGNSVTEIAELGRSDRPDVAAAAHVVRGSAGPDDPSYQRFGIENFYRETPTLTGMFGQRIAALFEGR